MKRKRYISHSEEETKKIAGKIFSKLSGGDVAGLKGDLGVGKTVFVKGAMESLQYKNTVQSPTFVIRNDYNVDVKGVKKIIHIDLYRLDTVTKKNDEFLEGVGDKDSITFIEWPERLNTELKKKMVNITISFDEKDSRIIIV